MKELEDEAKMIFNTLDWWDKQSTECLNTLGVLMTEEPKNDEAIEECFKKLRYLFVKGQSEVKNIDRFIDKYGLDEE